MHNPLKEWLETNNIGQNIIILDNIDSTNVYAKDLLNHKPPTGTVIIAKTQSGGKGQKSNYWDSPEGGLYYTSILPAISHERITMITLTVGLACQEAILETTGLNTKLKWVNDILYNNKKIGGILVESRIRGNNAILIIGIGINVNTKIDDLNPELKAFSTTILNETSTHNDVFKLAAIISNKLEKYFDLFNSQKYNLIKSLWIKNSDTIGKKVELIYEGNNYEGLVIDINNQGALNIQSMCGKQFFILDNKNITYL